MSPFPSAAESWFKSCVRHGSDVPYCADCLAAAFRSYEEAMSDNYRWGQEQACAVESAREVMKIARSHIRNMPRSASADNAVKALNSFLRDEPEVPRATA